MKEIILRPTISETMFTDEILAGDKQNIYAVINGSYCYIKQINRSFYWYFTETNRIASSLHGNTILQLVESTLIQKVATSVKFLTEKEVSSINS